MPDYRHVARIDLGECPYKSEPGKGIAHLPVFQQPELQGVPCLLPVCSEFAVHQVDGVRALVGGQPDAAPEEK